jgi:hypothetical protein
MERNGELMTTAQELGQNIGKHATLHLPSSPLRFTVEIVDARKRYGNLDYKVRPLAGGGETWHQAHLVTVHESEQ